MLVDMRLMIIVWFGNKLFRIRANVFFLRSFDVDGFKRRSSADVGKAEKL